MTLTCPRCKNRLPWIWGDGTPKPQPGDWIECGMCPNIWQYKAEAEEKGGEK